MPNFLPPALQAFHLSLLAFTFFGQFEGTKLNSVRKVPVLNGEVRKVSPRKIFFFYYKLTLEGKKVLKYMFFLTNDLELE